MRRILERTGLAVTTVMLSILVILAQHQSTQTLPAFIQFGQLLAVGSGPMTERSERSFLPAFEQSAETMEVAPPAAMPEATIEHSPARILNVRMLAGKGVSRLIFDLDQPALVRCENSSAGALRFTFEQTTLSLSAREDIIQADDIVTGTYWAATSREKPVLFVKVAPSVQYQVSSLTNPDRIVVDFASPEAADFLSFGSSDLSRLSAPSRGLADSLALKVRRVVIDPGHGGSDNGAVGPTGLTEKEVTLDVAQRLKSTLETQYGIEVLLTRADDQFVPLEKRSEIANQNGADLFISLHVNATENGTHNELAESRGVEAYCLSLSGSPEAMRLAARENQLSDRRLGELSNLVKKIALAEVGGNSQLFATQLVDTLSAGISPIDPRTGQNRGSRSAPLLVLVGVKAPATLIELPFISNLQDEALLKNDSFRERLARSIAQGIASYANASASRRSH